MIKMIILIALIMLHRVISLMSFINPKSKITPFLCDLRVFVSLR